MAGSSSGGCRKGGPHLGACCPWANYWANLTVGTAVEGVHKRGLRGRGSQGSAWAWYSNLALAWEGVASSRLPPQESSVACSQCVLRWPFPDSFLVIQITTQSEILNK